MTNPDLSHSLAQVENDLFTPRAALAALGIKLAKLDLFAPIRNQVKIKQKTVRYSPDQKLYTAFLNILAGGKKMVELNKLVRADFALQQTFIGVVGAEQSVVQTTLDACSEINLVQMHQAIQDIFRTYSHAYKHDYQKEWQLLDVDMTGAPCGKKAALATKGYFANQRRNRRGRQIGRVLATTHREIVVDRLYTGTAQLNNSLGDLIAATEQVLGLEEKHRQRTIWRIDAGGGSLNDVNKLLARDYQVHCKDYSAQRTRNLTKSVKEWFRDPLHGDREVGWVTLESGDYVRPIRRIALRFKKANGQWGEAVIISTLPGEDVQKLAGEAVSEASDQKASALAYVHFYDQRGGGIETEFKEDKAGLGLSSRNKKSFWGQAMVVQLGTLAHNVLIWARDWLSEGQPKLSQYGIKRMVRDLLTISGVVLSDNEGKVWVVILNRSDNYAKLVKAGLAKLLAVEHVAVVLGQI